MIGQYLPNNNETATVAFRQKFCQLNSLTLPLTSQHDNTVALTIQLNPARDDRQCFELRFLVPDLHRFFLMG
jgi:hypothetical protein